MTLAAQPQPSPDPSPPDFATIYNTQGAYVRRTLQRMGVPDRHLDDAMQDVFVVVLRRLPEYRDRNRLEALQQHAQVFRGGMLVEQRERLWIEALIQAGRPVEARRRLKDFARSYPRSPALDALRRAVDAPTP